MKDSTYFLKIAIDDGCMWDVVLEHTTTHLICKSARAGRTEITVEYLSYAMNPELCALYTEDGWNEDELHSFLSPGMFGLLETVHIPVVGHVS